jgi:hypothetical protein
MVIALGRSTTDQGIAYALIQATDCVAVVSLSVNFKIGSHQKLRRELLNRETDGVNGVSKTPISNRLPPGFPVAPGEQLRLDAKIKPQRAFFNSGCIGHSIITSVKGRSTLNDNHSSDFLYI